MNNVIGPMSSVHKMECVRLFLTKSAYIEIVSINTQHQLLAINQIPKNRA